MVYLTIADHGRTCGLGADYALGKANSAANSLYPSFYNMDTDWGAVRQVAVAHHSICVATEDNRILCQGLNNHYSVGSVAVTQVTPNEVTTWTPIAASQTIVQLEGGCYFFGIRTSLGEAYFWGQGAYYQTMVDSTTNSFDLKKAMIPAGRKAVDLVIDTHCTVIRLDDNTLFGGGFNLNKMHLSPINENAKYHILESVPNGENLLEFGLSYNTLVYVSTANKVYARTSDSDGITASCLSAAATSFTQVNDNGSADLQGHALSVKCARHACIFTTDQGKVLGCSTTALPGATGSHATPVGTDIAASLNASCESGKAVNNIWRTRYGFYFGGEGCHASKLFGFQQYGAQGAVCRSSYTAATVVEVIDVSPNTIVSAQSYSDHVAVLSKQ